MAEDIAILPSDRVVITLMVVENGASEANAALFLKVLQEGIRRGEADSQKVVLEFRELARRRGADFIATVQGLADDATALEKALGTMRAHADLLEEVATMDRPQNEVSGRIALRNLQAKASTLPSVPAGAMETGR
jgi:acetylglutamate synthase